MKISFIVIDHPTLAIGKKQGNMIFSPGPGLAQIIYEVGKI
jgi:hypothetical protein